jgi:hypothetical protein
MLTEELKGRALRRGGRYLLILRRRFKGAAEAILGVDPRGNACLIDTLSSRRGVWKH